MLPRGSIKFVVVRVISEEVHRLRMCTDEVSFCNKIQGQRDKLLPAPLIFLFVSMITVNVKFLTFRLLKHTCQWITEQYGDRGLWCKITRIHYLWKTIISTKFVCFFKYAEQQHHNAAASWVSRIKCFAGILRTNDHGGFFKNLTVQTEKLNHAAGLRSVCMWLVNVSAADMLPSLSVQLHFSRDRLTSV